MPWRTIEGETLAPATMPQLEVLLRGVFDKRRFLDLIRHFIVFDDDGTSLIKKVTGYHQFHAINTAISETIRAAGTGSLAVREEPGFAQNAVPKPSIVFKEVLSVVDGGQTLRQVIGIVEIVAVGDDHDSWILHCRF
jgi:hypothetical protein